MTHFDTFPTMEPGDLRDGDLALHLVEFTPHRVHQVPAYQFRMMRPATGEEVGAINLRIGSGRHIEWFAGHIGYRVHPPYRGHRYAARSVRLLLPLARRFGIDPLWITCDPDNLASRRSLELAGAEFVEVAGVPEDCAIFQSGHPRKCRYRLGTSPVGLKAES